MGWSCMLFWAVESNLCGISGAVEEREFVNFAAGPAGNQ